MLGALLFSYGGASTCVRVCVCVCACVLGSVWRWISEIMLCAIQVKAEEGSLHPTARPARVLGEQLLSSCHTN